MKSVIPILRKYLTKEVFEKDGFLYEKYFNDKFNSKNETSKSLSGEI